MGTTALSYHIKENPINFLRGFHCMVCEAMILCHWNHLDFKMPQRNQHTNQEKDNFVLSMISWASYCKVLSWKTTAKQQKNAISMSLRLNCTKRWSKQKLSSKAKSKIKSHCKSTISTMGNIVPQQVFAKQLWIK